MGLAISDFVSDEVVLKKMLYRDEKVPYVLRYYIKYDLAGITGVTKQDEFIGLLKNIHSNLKERLQYLQNCFLLYIYCFRCIGRRDEELDQKTARSFMDQVLKHFSVVQHEHEHIIGLIENLEKTHNKEDYFNKQELVRFLNKYETVKIDIKIFSGFLQDNLLN